MCFIVWCMHVLPISCISHWKSCFWVSSKKLPGDVHIPPGNSYYVRLILGVSRNRLTAIRNRHATQLCDRSLRFWLMLWLFWFLSIYFSYVSLSDGGYKPLELSIFDTILRIGWLHGLRGFTRDRDEWKHNFQIRNSGDIMYWCLN